MTNTFQVPARLAGCGLGCWVHGTSKLWEGSSCSRRLPPPLLLLLLVLSEVPYQNSLYSSRRAIYKAAARTHAACVDSAAALKAADNHSMLASAHDARAIIVTQLKVPCTLHAARFALPHSLSCCNRDLQGQR